jgi:hypothetical protein
MVSNRRLVIPVRPKLGAGTYLEGAVVDHSDALSPNSKRVARIITPKNFNTSHFVVSFKPADLNRTLVRRSISCSSDGGNISKK